MRLDRARAALLLAAICLLLPLMLGAADDESQEQARKLDPLTQARATAGLLGIVLLGVVMVAMVILGAYFTRRRARLSRGASRYGHPELRVTPLNHASDDGGTTGGSAKPHDG